MAFLHASSETPSMSDPSAPVAIVDYGLGNLYSVQRACDHVGLPAIITSSPADVARAPGILLPGVGAMPTAMQRLKDSGLAPAIVASVRQGTPVFGICLGLQLLFTRGTEFSDQEGLGLIEGTVSRIEGTSERGPLRVPHIGWSAVDPAGASRWADTPLEGMARGTMMYFVHSFYVQPADPSVCVATTRYGSAEFCAAVARDNVFACQFHPERSGPVGLTLYARFAQKVQHPEAMR